MDDVEGFTATVEKITADVVETEGDVEFDTGPEDVTELLYSCDKT